MLLGYSIGGVDADNNMYGDYFEYAPPHPCNAYRCIYDINFLPDNFRIPKKKADIFNTYDGFMLVTTAVKDFCKVNKFKNIEFVKMPNYENFYWMKPHEMVFYDLERQKFERIGFSKKCNAYKEMIGPTPVCLKNNNPIGDGFFRTDISSGSVNGKSPIICIGIKTKEKIEKAGLRGIYFEAILDSYDWEKKKLKPK